jgi:uncharacterized protein DUF4351
MEQSDYDSPWKDALDFLFDSFIALFFPSAHAQIGWSRGFEFLDKELQKITADAAGGTKMEYVTSFERHGIRKGSAKIVLLLLQRRFGALNETMQSRIGALLTKRLEELSVALLDFSSLQDLEDWLRRHPLPSAILRRRRELRPARAQSLNNSAAHGAENWCSQTIGFLHEWAISLLFKSRDCGDNKIRFSPEERFPSGYPLPRTIKCLPELIIE